MAIGLAIAALVLSALSLAFTAYQWRRSGPGVEVRIWLPGHSESPRDYYTFSQQITEPLVVKAEVQSAGRASVPVVVRKLVLTVGAVETETIGVSNAERRMIATPLWLPDYIEPKTLSRPLPASLAQTDVLEAEFEVGPIEAKYWLANASARVQYGFRWFQSPDIMLLHFPQRQRTEAEGGG